MILSFNSLGFSMSILENFIFLTYFKINRLLSKIKRRRNQDENENRSIIVFSGSVYYDVYLMHYVSSFS